MKQQVKEKVREKQKALKAQLKNLNNKQVSLSEANVSDMELLIWMKQSAAQIKSSGGNAQETRRRGRNLNQILNSTSGVSQIAISRSQPRDNQQHQIWLDEVEFNQLLRWLSELQNDYGVFVSNLNLSSSPKTGYVRANITFQDSSAGG